VHFRRDWTPDAFAASFAVRWYGGHCHADMGAFTLWSHGRFWATDSGYGQRWADAHNVVLVDGKGPFMEAGSGQVAVGGELLQYFDSPLASVAECDTTDSWRYAFRGHRDHVQRWPYSGGVALARRAFAVVWGDEKAGVPPYALVHDHIFKDDAERTYDWLLQTWDDHRIDVKGNAADVHCPFNDRWLEGPGAFKDESKQSTWIEHDVEVREAGEYRLYVFGRGDDGWEGSALTGRIDGKPVGYGHVGGATWGWAALSRKPLALGVGKHTVRIQRGWGAAAPRLKWLMLTRAEEPDLARSKALVNDAESVSVELGDGMRIEGEGWQWVHGPESPPRLQVEFLLPAELRLRTDLYDRKARWRDVHPRLHAETKAVRGRFLVLLYPRAPGADAATVQLFEKRYAFRHQVIWPGAVDYIAEPSLSKGGEGTDGSFALVRCPTADGHRPLNKYGSDLGELPDDTRYLMVSGTRLTFCRNSLVKLTDDLLGELNWMTAGIGVRATVARAGNRLDVLVRVDPLAQYPIERHVAVECFGPGVDTVTFNGQPAEFERDGKLVRVRGRARLHESVLDRLREQKRESYDAFHCEQAENAK
jgi:hypothetical protein